MELTPLGMKYADLLEQEHLNTLLPILRKSEVYHNGSTILAKILAVKPHSVDVVHQHY